MKEERVTKKRIIEIMWFFAVCTQLGLSVKVILTVFMEMCFNGLWALDRSFKVLRRYE